jgi:hypothetical protein
MNTNPLCSAQVLSAAPPGEFSYQAMTIAAIVLVLASVWIF